MRTVQVRILGRVQGVGYRVWLQRTALQRGLSGWVRNRIDGSVEAVMQGAVADVEAVLEACKAGPRMAGVTRVEVAEASPEPFTGFEVRETA